MGKNDGSDGSDFTTVASGSHVGFCPYILNLVFVVCHEDILSLQNVLFS